ncbi:MULTISPECIES: hypothetical protein [Anoxybacillus]|uniref:hypothetical protein n=1 Tax=Anoxybacillus TaxID=150247 RepID=UPI000ADD9298|nr:MULTISPECIES: hypothetical protein [Anoxybacillus]MCG6196063.1 hypothetical protein [Anoxybacillus sp. LAT_38]MBE2906708.1 hypothetical protein [Anoxybacillus flavithermus]MBE2910039.1 hypothetical protein [Anoxybacillus flavithermus]MBE2912381.1 hypothetical protein [Anoxybacillus flavithermus]MBE2915591.1 hypothetical protein [Anoxybacillus flavithermus]
MFKKLFTQKEKGCCDVQIIEVKDDEKKEDCCEGKEDCCKEQEDCCEDDKQTCC